MASLPDGVTLTCHSGGSSYGVKLPHTDTAQLPCLTLAQCWNEMTIGFLSCTLLGPTSITGARIVCASAEQTTNLLQINTSWILRRNAVFVHGWGRKANPYYFRHHSSNKAGEEETTLWFGWTTPEKAKVNYISCALEMLLDHTGQRSVNWEFVDRMSPCRSGLYKRTRV